MSQPTPAQQEAIDVRGNALVVAGAGAGKTRTLVERCVSRLLAPRDPVAVDRILMLTFTDAAAAEMRHRIRGVLVSKLAEDPGDEALVRQLALLDTAPIGTLHSFCLRLVREHFYELELDPQLAVLDEAEARLMAAEVLDRLLDRHYEGKEPDSEGVRGLIATIGRGGDEIVRSAVMDLFRYSRSLARPEEWLGRQREAFGEEAPRQWQQWLVEGLERWRQDWLEVLAELAPDNPNAAQGARVLKEAPESLDLEAAGTLVRGILEVDREWPSRQKGKLRKPIEKLFADAEFLRPYVGEEPEGDTAEGGFTRALQEDWTWVRSYLKTLIDLTLDFGRRFAEAKRELAAIDFADLEQFALRLLWDEDGTEPSDIARQWRERLDLVFVDEFQDINAAQNEIIRALSRDGGAENRFLVGDVKQSIYRFRLADPRIFLATMERWRQGSEPSGKTIALADNFRSHEALIDFINPLFDGLMRREMGGVEFDESARIAFGAREQRQAISRAANPGPRVEVALQWKDGDSDGDDDGNADDGGFHPGDLNRVEREARAVGLRLLQLRNEPFQVWRPEQGMFEEVHWRDMVVLLRSPRNKAESYAKEFARLGIPLEAPRGGFFEAIEVSDLFSLLKLLDNPLQDIPVLAVLRSPMVGLTLDELAVIRRARPRGPIWLALLQFHELFHGLEDAGVLEIARGMDLEEVSAGDTVALALPKVERFLASFHRWRKMARESSLLQCLETVLDETHYEDWLGAQERGDQRRNNVQRLLLLARNFDQFQRQGLFRFLKYIEAQKENDIDREPASEEAPDAVRLMSIHQSKGLEYPVVVLADLGAPFNFSDTSGGLIRDEKYGMCPRVTPPELEQSYPSVVHWLAGRRQKEEQLGEEQRLLYVALTRARDLLILSGGYSQKAAGERWAGEAAARPPIRTLRHARCYLDWLGPRLTRLAGQDDWFEHAEGSTDLFSWRVLSNDDLSENASAGEPTGDSMVDFPAPTRIDGLLQRLQWKYPYQAATEEHAKSSVSALKHRFRNETDDESAWPFRGVQFQSRPSIRAETAAGVSGPLSATEIGIAHHKFLQFVSLAETGDDAALRREAARLAEAGRLTDEEAAALDFAAVAEFWQTEIGRRLRECSGQVRRELPFTVRLSPNDLDSVLTEHAELREVSQTGTDEFVVVQGVVDVALIRPDSIEILDFKTDRFPADQLDEKVVEYRSQIRLYAMALKRVYGRPVSTLWLHFFSHGETVQVV